MKSNYLAIAVLVLAVLVCVRTNTVQAASLDQWDLKKEYTLEKNSVKYYAYLSKDKKESWIYKAELLDKNKMLDVVFPKEMEGLPVTCLGITNELEWAWDKGDCYYNLFGQSLEPWGYYDKRPLPKIVNVRSVILPDSVTEMGDATFACMSNLKYVHLPKKIITLVKYMFYGCKDLQNIDFAPKIEVPDSTVFQFCDGLKGLMEESDFRREGMIISCKGSMLIYEDLKKLIQVMPKAKKITIPAYVKEIEPAAFQGCSLQKVKINKKNKKFAVQGRSLYNRKDGRLLLVFGKGSRLTFSKRIKKLDKYVMVAKYKIKKIVIENKLQRKTGWKKPFLANNKKVKIYYCGKRIR